MKMGEYVWKAAVTMKTTSVKIKAAVWNINKAQNSF